MQVGKSKRSGFIAGFFSWAVMLAASTLISFAFPLPTAIDPVWNAAVSSVPGPLFSAVLDMLKYAAKPLFYVAILTFSLVAAGVFGILWVRISEINRPFGHYSRRQPLAVGTILGLVLCLVAILAFVHGQIQIEAWSVPLASLFGFGVLLVELLARLEPIGLFASEAKRPPVVDLVRRDLLFKTAVVVIALALGGVLLKMIAAIGEGLGTLSSAAPARLRDYITSNAKFYHVSKDLTDPVVAAGSWRLEIKGLVSKPYVLTLDELKSLPSLTPTVTLECISNEVGGDLISNAVWRGVRFRDLLARAGVSARAVDVALFASDGYSDSIPISKALDPAVVLAYEMNGDPLPTIHGFPARLLVPGIYGMKNVKWLTTVELVDYDYKGFWQEQGWSDVATVHTTSIIDVPGNGETVSGKYTVAGIAFAGDRGISRVEVSFDRGRSWHQAALEKTDSPDSWVRWHLDWQFVNKGSQTITVRAVDGRGSVQTEASESTYPNGATGYDSVEFIVGVGSQ